MNKESPFRSRWPPALSGSFVLETLPSFALILGLENATPPGGVATPVTSQGRRGRWRSEDRRYNLWYTGWNRQGARLA
jgi:hypothetical protein